MILRVQRGDRARTARTLGSVLAFVTIACVCLFQSTETSAIAAAPIAAASNGLRFSDPPRDEEFLRAGSFAQPLAPVASTTPQENRDLARALTAYFSRVREGADIDDVAPLTQFLAERPSSPWRPALLFDVASIDRQTGHFSAALRTWQEAWDASKALTTPYGVAFGDASLAALSQFEAYLGRKELLAPLLEQARSRQLRGTAAELVSESARGLADMNHAPGISFRCGPMALKRILQSAPTSTNAEPVATALRALDGARSTPNGLSLSAVARASESAGMRYQMAFRSPGAQVILPSVVHWKVGHYAAIIKDEGGRYQVEDPTFGQDVRMRPATLDEEASGYFLVPRGALPKGWRTVDSTEGDKVWGRGNTGTNKDNGATGNETQANNTCPGGGCTSWNVEAMVVGLSLHDTPVGYKPPFGPQVKLDLNYSHRDVQQPAIFTYTNFGNKWTTTWLSYVTDNIATNGTIDLYRRGGGDEPFTFDTGVNVSQKGIFSQSVFTRRVDGSNATTGFSRQLNDGSLEDFSLSAGGHFFLTSVIDPQGNKVTISYDPQTRITKLTDAIGQDTVFSYELPSDPLKVTKVTDPFGRAATFTYNAAGQLASITDVLGITSSYTYGANDFVQQLKTPYGTSSFVYGDALTDPTLLSTRFVEATDALGRTMRVEFTNESIDGPESGNLDPDGAPAVNPVDDPNGSPTPIVVENFYVQYRNTFVWDPIQYAAAKGKGGPTSTTGFDHSKAKILHWLHTADETATSRTLESVKSPLEKRIWYAYEGQTSGYDFGTSNLVTGVGRLLDDGSSVVEAYTYNAVGRMTQSIDATGRTWAYTYAPNNIDLLTVTNTTGGAQDVLFTATYNAQHEPLTIVGANGKTTSYVYNAAGQITQVTDAAGNVTKLTYDSKGYLTNAQGPVAGATETFTYDNVGRIATATDAGGMTVTLAYDAADRPVGATFPDGTSTKLTYNLLDLATMTDRLGQTTTMTFDAQRELVAMVDALGQTTKYAYSTAGKLTSITDANGHTTSWTRDGQERVTGKTFADGTSETTAYEASTSRVHQTTDADGRTTTYAYTLDDNPASLVRAVAGATSETLMFAYDPTYARPTTMTDAIGTTTYAYFPVGGLGANQLQSVTSPVAGAAAGTMDTVAMTYDALGRQVSRNVDGVTDSAAFDALGRTTTVTSPLDTFTYAYADGTPRVSSVTSAHGPAFAYTYDDPKGDDLLKEIEVTAPDKSALAQLDYTYNADDNVVSFTQSYLGKVLAGNGASGAVLGPMLKSLENKPNASSRESRTTTWKSVAETAAAAAVLMLFVLFGLRRNARGLRGGWLAPIMLGLLFLGCGHDSATGPASGTQYLYDATNRVTAAKGEGPASYTYDAASNLTSITSSATAQQTLTYGSTNAISSSGAAYDKSGNPTSLDGTTYTWDAAHRVTSAVSGAHESDFTYDGLSRLVRIVDKNAGKVTSDKAFVWCGAERCAAHDNLQASSPVSTRYFGEGVVDGGASYYYVRDRLGSVRQLVDASGKVRAEYDYDPYGNRTKLAGDLESDFGYAGYFHHAADPAVNGLDFALYRAYDARHGRWLNRDAIGEKGGLNLYEYTAGNPVNVTDPSGLIVPIGPILIGAFEGAIVSAADDAAGQALNSSSDCIDWNEVGASALIGAALGGASAGAGAGAGEGGNCFSGETVVATSSAEKPISEIHIGEKVWSRDEATGERELRPVVEKFVTPGRALIDLDIAAGAKDEVVRTTPTHRFWVDDRGWTEAQALRAGDAFDLYMGSHAVLVQSVRETETSTVYNIEVEGTHTYFVGELGVWVHNACGPSAKPNWPPNNGFAEGSGGDVTVLPNQILDRYGDPGGGFLAPAGTPFAERALPDGYDSKPLNSYFVAQPFTAAGGQSAPAFGQPGGGIQFYLGSSTVQDLVDRGILIPWSGEL